MVSADDGGYDTDTGFDPAASGPVPASPVLRADFELPSGTDSDLQRKAWLSLDQHSEDVRDQAARLLDVLSPDLPHGAASSAVLAGYLHDAGKAHEIWQDALCALPTTTPLQEIDAGRPWAKSDNDYPLQFKDDVPFRHELASLLLLDGPLRDLLAEADDQDLVRYLVLAHHGQLRMRVCDPGAECDTTILGLEHGTTTAIPPMLGRPASELTVNLDQFRSGAWAQLTHDLLGRYGPFTLAYLETIVRVADWRASSGMDAVSSVTR